MTNLSIKMGQHSYTPEQREAIIEHVIAQVAAGRGVRRILEEDEGMPSFPAFWNWVRLSADLHEQLTRARELGAETLLDEAIEIADNSNGDLRVVTDRHGEQVIRVDGEAVARSRLRAEMRQKHAALIAPKRFGAKVDITSGGEALPAPSAIAIDARVQSILLMASQRADAAKLLED